MSGAMPSARAATPEGAEPDKLSRASLASTIAVLRGKLGFAHQLVPVGSRVTCNPPPTDTDEDWLALTWGDASETMRGLGFTQDGSPQFYTGNDNGGFRSWRLGNLNVVTTESREFFDRFCTATDLAKRFNLMAKADRIALFQAVLYGIRAENLEH